jgi:hypothetical protein
MRAEPLPVLSLGEKDMKRELRLEGVYSRASEGKAHSQADLVMRYIQRERHVDYAGPLAGKRIGVYDAQGRRILVTSAPRMIEPRADDWPKLRALLSGLLTTADADQTPWLFAWLKVGIVALRNGQTRPGHVLIMAGPSDCGKSFVQEHVITPLLGGRSADPTNYLLGKTTFNAEMGGAEHLAMQELPSGLDFKSRVLLADELKRLIATEKRAGSHRQAPPLCSSLFPFAHRLFLATATSPLARKEVKWSEGVSEAVGSPPNQGWQRVYWTSERVAAGLSESGPLRPPG